MVNIHICYQQDILTRWGLAISINILYLNNGTNILHSNCNWLYLVHY